ncbi:PTS system, beta-glucoside-specific IIA component [Enterococcus sp. DIV2402]|uniref:PTS system, beta-glucoside-specific IIA component n=1 Tax=Candidatus Enterococcus lowellii TaxID=2230877 RepID=A0ABZ2SVI1_9ENTE|nr:beta-glucoside-specific PTS transporter subunit IIABC [Enterococcus sp. DIV2402]MBO0463299.1 PTS glucose transporter subunit IIA [Enterococcus sp. DIV2402]
MNYEKLATEILANVGGSQNILNVWHCATRLRFKLKDETQADTKTIENLEGVVTVVQSAGQDQVVIGNSVSKVYDAITSLHSELGESDSKKTQADEKQSLINRLLAFVSSVFTPFLGALAASGILKGLLVLTTTLNIFSESDGAYQVWSAASDAIFYFLPLFIGFTAAKQLKVNQFVAVTIAGALVYPNLVSLLAETGGIDFFGLPIQAATYSDSVIPILLAIWLLSYIEPVFDKIFPESVRNIFTPLLSIMIMVPLTLLVVGPIGNIVSTILASILASLYNFSPTIAGFILGGIHQVIVIFGVHWALITLMINNISEYGQDPWLPIVCIAVFAQAGSALGVFLKTKNKKMKSLSGSAFVTAIFSITEPAIYGVNLKLKKPMYFALASSAIGGAIAGFGEVKASTFTFPGILAIPTYLGEGFIFEIVGLLTAICLAAGLTYFFGGVNNTPENADDLKAKDDETNRDDFKVLPIKGKTIHLSEVNDEVFASGVMGKGLAIIPEENIVRSPIQGTITTIFETKHAIGLTNKKGVEVLIHIGIDTVNLKGQYFDVLVKEGEQVALGQELVQCDFTKIKEAGYDPTVMMVITNSTDFPNLSINFEDEKLVTF